MTLCQIPIFSHGQWKSVWSRSFLLTVDTDKVKLALKYGQPINKRIFFVLNRFENGM